MFAKLPFRTKLVLVVSVPLLVLVGFAGMGVASRVADLSDQEQYGDLLGPFDRLTTVSRTLGDESVASSWYAASRDTPAAQKFLSDARKATDGAVAALRAEMPAIRKHTSARTRASAGALLERLGTVDRTREELDAGTDPGDSYLSLSSDALDVASGVASNLHDRELASSLAGVIDLRRSQLGASDQATLVERYLVTGATSAAPAWAEAVREEESQVGRFLSTATTDERDAFARRSSAAPIDPVRDAAPSDVPSVFPTVEITPEEYTDAYRAKQTAIDQGIDVVQSVVNATASQKVSDARTATQLFFGATAAAIALVLFLALALVRSLNRPLRALTRAARDVSERRLPQLVDTLHQGGDLAPGQLEQFSPIRIDSRDEFGELAKAFNTIQQVTVSVAKEQSVLLRKGIGDLYVNLARRNQSLLDRQISLLDDMEGRTHQPDQLGALFELDQLATRMRRNAESLLVLAGSEQPRQWRTAVPVLDVVRAAAAEIADFARVTYFGFEQDIAVVGNAVADVTHLLAELLENATAFAPPETPVVVSGQVLDRSFLLTITDEGIGMDPDRLAEANQLLARPPVAGLALSRTLGLHVVGHLAVRHGIHVQLRRIPSAGVSAVVSLPPTILALVGEAPTATAGARPARAPEPVPAEPMPPPPDPAPSRAGAHVDTDQITWRPSPQPAPGRAPGAPADPEPAVAREALPRRVTTRGPVGKGRTVAGAPSSNGRPGRLASRVPGANLTHRPEEHSAPVGDDVRPRPERVQDFLTRHQRGVREGRDSGDDRA